jgi:hypothetical protein
MKEFANSNVSAIDGSHAQGIPLHKEARGVKTYRRQW